MQILDLIDKWSLNRNTLSARIKMHSATFNNKLSPNNPSRLTVGERDKLVNTLRLMEKDIHDTIKANWVSDQDKEKICPDCGHENSVFMGKEYKCPVCKNSWLPIKAEAQLL